MKTIYLGDLPQRTKGPSWAPVQWLEKHYGPAGDRWTLRDLAFVDFRKDRDADLFLLQWN
jgi:hypothetical protein